MINMEDLLVMLSQKKASDLHITPGVPPMLRLNGEMMPTELEKLTPDACQKLIYSLLTDSQKEKFEANNELDLSFGIKGFGRVRMNVFRQRGSVAAALRSIPTRILSFEELNLPPVVFEMMKLKKGLILVTGTTGSGKSTTLASMIDYINEHRSGHIMTVEDPIEYIHYHKKCVVNQREVGSDTGSFTSALKYVLRQDPDVILVGEMRDLETISACLTIAETGHLVFATLHTTDAASSINRIIDVFPPHQQYQIRSQLSLTLHAVLAQQLIQLSSGAGRTLACEVLMATPAVKSLIRDMKVEQLYLSMQTGSKFGMQTMNQAICDLYNKRKISYQTAIDYSSDKDDIKRILDSGNRPLNVGNIGNIGR